MLSIDCSMFWGVAGGGSGARSEEHTSELQSLRHLVCRLLLEKKKKNKMNLSDFTFTNTVPHGLELTFTTSSPPLSPRPPSSDIAYHTAVHCTFISAHGMTALK